MFIFPVKMSNNYLSATLVNESREIQPIKLSKALKLKKAVRGEKAIEHSNSIQK